MRIAIDIRPLLERQWSGVATYTDRAVAALAARSSHEYALWSNAFAPKRRRPLLEAASFGGSLFSRYPNKLLNASFAFTGRPRIEDLVGGADAVYLPNLNFVATKKPMAVTVHDLSFVRYPQFFSAKQRLWHSLVRPKRMLQAARAVIAVSEHTKRDIVETYGIPPERIHVVHPGVSADYRPRGPQELADLRRRMALPERFFLYLGTLEPRKNVTGLIEAFERLPGEPRLLIAGGRGWLYRDIFRRAAASPARERIRFLDYVSETDKPLLYNAATALIYPSFYEGFGMPPLEAMASGTPVIASHASSLGEVVGDAGVLVDPYNIAEIGDAMQAVLEEPALRQRLSERGIAAAGRFTWEESAKKLEEVFLLLK